MEKTIKPNRLFHRFLCFVWLSFFFPFGGNLPDLFSSVAYASDNTIMEQRFPEGKAVSIQLRIPQDTVNSYTKREFQEQWRDWLLYTIASNIGADHFSLGQALFDRPILRRGEFNAVARYEYGSTRAMIAPNGDVIALLPSSETSNARIDLLARIADNITRETGEKPKRLHPFHYKIDLKTQQAHLTRFAPVSASVIFSKSAGYSSLKVCNEADLMNFLQQSDIILLNIGLADGQCLYLNSRKVLARHYRGLSLNEVAELWQAQTHTNKQNKLFSSLQEKLKEHNEEASRLRKEQIWLRDERDRLIKNKDKIRKKDDELYGSIFSFFERKNAFEKAVKIFQKNRKNILSQIQQKKYLKKNELGFSLDPSYDYTGIQQFLASFEPTLRKVAFSKSKTKLFEHMKVWYKQQKGSSNKAILAEIEALYKKGGENNEKEEQRKKSNAGGQNKFRKSNNPTSKASTNPASVGHEKSQKQKINKFFKLIKNFYKIKFESLVSEKRIEEIKNDLKNNNIVSYLKWIKELAGFPLIRARLLASELRWQLSHRFSFQKARYDGEKIQGSEVGMVMFYTDLLAKLWALDFHKSTPKKIEDFLSPTQRKISQAYEREIRTLTNTRVWFGSRDDGGFRPQQQQLLFAHNAARIYSASSDPLKPGKETTPNAQTGAFLDWWNLHYEEIAWHEQEYQRLNEIMKWSIGLTWLQSQNALNRLSYLDSIPLRYNRWFPRWTKSNANKLTFKKWQSINFFAQGHHGIQTEAMPLLFSAPYQFFDSIAILSGGVSLARKKSFEQEKLLERTIPLSMPQLLRRSHLNYKRFFSKNQNFSQSIRLETLQRVKFHVRRIEPNKTSSRCEFPQETKQRNRVSEFFLKKFEQIVEQSTKETTSFVLKSDRLVDAELQINSHKTGITLEVKPRHKDLIQRIAQTLSQETSLQWAKTLGQNPDIESVIRIDGGFFSRAKYLVQVKGHENWFELRVSSETLQKEIFMRTASIQNAKHVVDVVLFTESQIATRLKKAKYLHFEIQPNPSNSLLISISPRGPPDKVPLSRFFLPLSKGSQCSYIEGFAYKNNKKSFFKIKDALRDNTPKEIIKGLHQFVKKLHGLEPLSSHNQNGFLLQKSLALERIGDYKGAVEASNAIDLTKLTPRDPISIINELVVLQQAGKSTSRSVNNIFRAFDLKYYFRLNNQQSQVILSVENKQISKNIHFDKPPNWTDASKRNFRPTDLFYIDPILSAMKWDGATDMNSSLNRVLSTPWAKVLEVNAPEIGLFKPESFSVHKPNNHFVRWDWSQKKPSFPSVQRNGAKWFGGPPQKMIKNDWLSKPFIFRCMNCWVGKWGTPPKKIPPCPTRRVYVIVRAKEKLNKP